MIQTISAPLTKFRKHCAILLITSAVAAVSASVRAGSAPDPQNQVSSNAIPIYLDRGALGLSRCLAQLHTRASILMITAHPDDEDGGLLAYATRGLGARGALMSLTRGEGGQNAMSTDMYDALGLVRTQELLTADQYYGVEQYWGREIDYGFSKTREEALEKWGYDRTLSDVVRVVRMTRPLVLTSVFIGAPTDGHGNHQVAGQMAQEAYLAAGDPNRYPEQIREGLRPWTPLKVYGRVPFFAPTKEGQIYDYATDKFVPVRFFDYVNKTWMSQKPPVNLEVAEGTLYPPAGLTFSQMARQGWGFQKSQNGGGTLPQPSLVKTTYHRYGSRVEVPEMEDSPYRGIDISLAGIASLATGNTTFLTDGLKQIEQDVDNASTSYNPNSPEKIAPALADGLKQVRALEQRTRESNLAEPGRSDVVFELQQKEQQFQAALIHALGLSFDATVAPANAPSGPLSVFAGTPATFTIAIPGQSFVVQTHLLNTGNLPLKVEDVRVTPSDGKDWSIKSETPVATSLEAKGESRSRFALKVPDDATITEAYFTRPNQEQPYYDLKDERYRNLSLATYPLQASVRIIYEGSEIQLRKVVQTNHRVEGIGMVEEPLIIAPGLSLTVSPGAGAVPLNAEAFEFSCTLHSNAKHAVKGAIHLHLPNGWNATPAIYPFEFEHDGDNETIAFNVQPHAVRTQSYEIKAIAECDGKTYESGYRLAGYPGLRPYPYYRPATYKAIGVDVKTAPGLRVGFIPGTGDDVPRALENLGLHPQILSGSDLESGNLKDFDAIVLGVRAYAVRPELRSANGRLISYVKNGGVLVVQYNLQSFDGSYGPYPFTMGPNPQKVVDETSPVDFPQPDNPVLRWPNRITAADFTGWEEERGHGFVQKWDPRYQPLVRTHDPDQDPQSGGLLLAKYGNGYYVYDAFALYRQLPAGVPGAYRILANLVSIAKNPEWK